ncbi:MerR family transcriptional regulator [Streptomyces sp. B-S-A8]|uniref:MerR family transcriptional regulator n=1 Tax=Streptomyces solicavernae TaxID=3043614 RepID=A0ABT6RXW8_9ACTN|nr:MerR family transcriptional regulator [Streptomyces sp. B-S-A8]MDI3389279.1 MerR family transcriptional regulator [Streptomyces sp. B-S-A8]
MWSIGELAERAGVTVKTVRFYSDRGLLPEAARSSGGHRRYGADALDRLRTIRALRTLDLPLPEVGRVLEGPDAGGALEDAVADRLRGIGSQLSALRWREAALRLLHECPPGERAERLRLVGAVTVPPSTDALARFWRRWLPPRLPAGVRSAVVEQAVPQLPEDPAPHQVLAFARLHAFVTGPCPGDAVRDDCQPAAHRAADGFRPAVLYTALGEAFAFAAPALRSGQPPCAGAELDAFVAAYAAAQGVRDTPAFRRGLSAALAQDPRIDGYWQLVTALTGPGEPNPGTAHDWLSRALAQEVGAPAPPSPDRIWGASP